MGARKMTDNEKRAAEMMSASRLDGGEEPAGVAKAISMWLMARGWAPTPAGRRSREVVARVEAELAALPKKSPVKASGIYEAWRLPGSDWQEGEISATEAKALGATIKVKGAAREFHVKFNDKWGDDRFPWKLRENQPVGTLGAEDNFVEVNEFSTMTSARAEARALARGRAP